MIVADVTGAALNGHHRSSRQASEALSGWIHQGSPYLDVKAPTGRGPGAPHRGSWFGRYRVPTASVDAISKALALSRSSVPEQVQRAALGLAQQVQEERPQPGRTGYQNGGGSWDEFQPDMGWGAVQNEAVPFATSIRLGRMG
jgi:hypothetical protein